MSCNVSLREKSIVLIGFMGVGKTTIGKAVAQKLNREFIDVDEEIEKKYGMPISSVFQQYGEEEFRETERLFVSELAQKKLQVLSLGGGSFLREDIRKTCLTHCIVFYLDMSFESWKERIHLIIDSRPVLQGKTEEDMRTLFNQRKEIYINHHSRIVIDQKEVEQVAEEIVDSLKMEWESED